MVKRVLLLGDNEYGNPAQHLGWEVIVRRDSFIQENDLPDVDLIQFTGGEDVCPALYGEHADPRTSHWPQRDCAELHVFKRAMEYHIPMVGICRGSQFLRVACGGSLYQHIDGHGIAGEHPAYLTDMVDTDGVREFGVTSTHHQAAAHEAEDDKFETLLEAKDGTIEGWVSTEYDIAAVQYHPEYMDKDSLGFQFYLDLLRYLTHESTVTFEV